MIDIDFFKNKMDYERLCFETEKLKKLDNTIDIFSIGKTWENRDIICIKIGKGKTKAIYVGAHHAMEWGTALALVYFALELTSSIKKKTKFYGYDYNLLLNKVSFYIIPMLNPDGINLFFNGVSPVNKFYTNLMNYNNNSSDFKTWQANIRGVDLNHNYNALFSKGKIIELKEGITGPCQTKYSGEYYESEKETIALCKFTRFIKPKMIIALHSQGKEIYYQYNNNKNIINENIAMIISKITGYKLARTEGTASYGGYKDWFINEIKGTGITIEMGEGINPLNFEQLLIAYKDIKEALICSPLLIKQ
ncbi:MAG: M14 family zinc carboxypeptidase [Clostridia bacterium]